MLKSSHTTTLGLEITSSQIRLVEADTSRWPIKVLNFAFLDLLSSHEDNIAQQIRGTLDRGWFKTNKINLALFHSSVIHRLLTLPPMPAGEIRAVLKREVEEIKLYPNEVVFDWRVISEVEEEGTKKNEILVVIAPLSEVDRQRSLVESSGLKCSVLTTVPLTLLSSLRFVDDGEKEAIALLYLNMKVGCLLFVREGKWCFSRQFPIEGKESILSEVKRSVHYFKQRFRGEDIDRVIISRDRGEDLDRVMENLREALGVEVSIFDPVLGLDLNLLGGRHKEWEQASPGLAVILGLLGESLKEPLINLVPARFKKGKRKLHEVLLALAVVFVLVTGYVGLSWHTESIKATLRQKEAILEEARSEERQKDLYNKYFSFLQEAEHSRYKWVEAFRFLSLTVTDGMVFHSLKAERMRGGLYLSINGEVMAADAFTAQEIFNRFYSRFKSSPLFSNIELMPIDIIRTEKQRSKADFKIRFQLKKEA